MRKILFALITVLLLTSCAPEVTPAYKNISTPSPAKESDITVTPLLNSTITSPPSMLLPSLEGESVSEDFNTADLEEFFALSSEELCVLLGGGFDLDHHNSEYTFNYADLGASFDYSYNFDDKNIIAIYDHSEDEPVMVLQRIVLSSFNFRGLNPMSDFDDVINTLGNSKLLALHNDNGYYYALRYAFGAILFEFSGVDQKGSEGLTLSVMPLSGSQVLYKSCGQGDSVSRTLTTGDIKLFLGLTPEELDSMIGNGETDFDEDTGIYVIYFDYLCISFIYGLGEADQGEQCIIYPVLPLERIGVDFEFRGLNENSTFNDVIQVLGQSEVLEIPIEDTEYYVLQYKIDGMLFEFSGSDSKASDGVSLSIMTDKN